MASKKTLIESELLLLRHRRGDPDALERLVLLWERPLYYYVRRLVDQEETAKDLAQDVWVTVFRNVRTVRDPAAFPAWLFRTARNQVSSHFRNSRTHVPLEEGGDVAAENEPLPQLDAEALHWCLEQLNPLHSECIILHYLEGFRLEEIAGIVGAPAGTVKSRIHYARKALRDLLIKEDSRHGL